MIKKYIKSVFILFLILAFNTNSFAAISVSDGSAFVTKSEFSADLNNISSRLSQVENSLDAKIDSLVSSYLSRNGIWNGMAVNTSTSAYNNTANKTTVISNIPKSGLMFFPYYVKIDYQVGMYAKAYGDKAESSVNRALGSPVFHNIIITLDIYENTTITQNEVFFYGLTGEFDTSAGTNYSCKVNIEPSKNLVFFVSKGNTLYYQMKTKVNLSMDWWGVKIALEGNNKTLSGNAYNNNVTIGYNTSSYYEIKFKTAAKVSIY